MRSLLKVTAEQVFFIIGCSDLLYGLLRLVSNVVPPYQSTMDYLKSGFGLVLLAVIIVGLRRCRTVTASRVACSDSGGQ
jgi:hypothetical protein